MRATLCVVGLAVLGMPVVARDLSQSEWPQWRGPLNTGMAIGDAPLRWSDASQVAWKLPVPRGGHSTPVIAGKLLFLTTAVPTGKGTLVGGGRAGGGADAGLEHRFDVIAIDRDTGTIAWQRTATVATPHEGYRRTYGSFASNSPVTDGTRVFAFFGSRGLYAYDLKGTLLWQKDFGIKMRMDLAFGEGTPLTLHEDRLLVHFDHLDTGFLAVLDTATGREIWRVKRTERYNWGRRGSLTGTDAIAWSTSRGAAYTPSPLLHDGRLYVITDSGQLSCFDAATGKPHYQQARLPQPYNFKASPVGALGKLYLASEEGDVVVVRMGDRFEVLATNTLDNQSFIASPVIVGGEIYLRSRTHLFKISGR